MYKKIRYRKKKPNIINPQSPSIIPTISQHPLESRSASENDVNISEKISKFTPILESMVKKILTTNQNDRGFPVVAAFYNDREIIDTEVNRQSKNGEKNNYNNHCETLMIHRHSLDGYRWCNLIVTIPSCLKCLKLLLKSNSGIKNIYYLDVTWNTHTTKKYKKLLKSKDVNLLKVEYESLDVLGKIYWIFLTYRVKDTHYWYKSMVDREQWLEVKLAIEIRTLLWKYDALVEEYMNNIRKFNCEVNITFSELNTSMISEKMKR